MITTTEIRALLNDIESDRVERTISTTNTDKFGQAICAFANDLPNHKQPGYLFLGVNDDGTIQGIDVTDDLLKNIAAIRTDGNIQPQPSMVVEKITMPEGDIVMVEVQPAVFPPVRYKGRVWVRVGPRKAVANDADVVIIDTAGRLHNKIGLMNELTKIKNVMQKVIPNAPHEILLVLDGSTGQNAFEQCKQFTEATDVNALAITKLDGTAKGGVVIGISDQFKIPVKYIGVGEGVNDLQLFDKRAFVDSLFN